uniref:RING-type domain-containing protein n=1 Tax=Angiostrongylus cantonensis TaxID=6313 RepID=A0A0K0DH88_ANGCA
MNVFTKPSMLSCGHSFCAGCIQHWLSENISCPTCRTDTQVPIRNIALEQVKLVFLHYNYTQRLFSLKGRGGVQTKSTTSLASATRIVPPSGLPPHRGWEVFLGVGLQWSNHPCNSGSQAEESAVFIKKPCYE